MFKKTWQKIILGFFLFLLAASGIYWYYATEKFTDTALEKPAYTVNAADLLHAFQTDSKAANQQYADKIVEVKGIITGTEAADSSINIKMADPGTGSYLIFAFQDQHLDEAAGLKKGDSVSIIGSCSGGVYSDILETHAITFKRSALIK
ncbi:MAG: hypothetical protein GC171_11320 [Terrimonas sp.]|nr:hypothetical protein [Terrimonas sp.]